MAPLRESKDSLEEIELTLTARVVVDSTLPTEIVEETLVFYIQQSTNALSAGNDASPPSSSTGISET
jgi:hypothetical protein